MFRIGEFAQIAQVSGRLLRYYDQLGLLSPVRIDPATGYRWYSAKQLPRLNRILALKDLGLTLEQIRPMIDGEIGVDAMRALLDERRERAEAAKRIEEARLRQIEARIALLDKGAGATGFDIVEKSVAAAPYIAATCACDDMEHAAQVAQRVVGAALGKVGPRVRDRLTVVSESGPGGDGLVLDIGFSLTRPLTHSVVLDDGLEMIPRELPAVERMATVVRSGVIEYQHFAFAVLAEWIEANGYVIGGKCREVFLEAPFDGATEPIVEMQFPVRAAT